jgi:hypothetical protein
MEYMLKIKITNRLAGLSDQQIQDMAIIMANYFPDQKLMEDTIRGHMNHTNTVRLALRDDEIVGFSVASKYKMMTPFYHRPVNVIYQRMLYIEPGILYRGVGIRLLLVTMKDLFGSIWPLKRIAAICRTQNPVVAKYMNMYNVAYPQYGQSVPAEIRKFAVSLLPVLGAESLDENFRLVGTLREFAGEDFTDTWNKYFHRRNNDYEKQMLNSAFEQKDGRVINSGALVLMIAYAKPLNFIRYIFH